ncbi:aminoacyl-tRNA deacylase [Marinobacterium sediminicola]|uniref:Ala-tRNA(Pro) deacylase n=1 Tax=Marinobacterium sediminicola TaxID=518898 RepID=A0ABY1RXR0_9GAMM|nr:YbaK/EbsC family protein [Marinobacterium sediminicola]ULG67797.1 YbaK/EbsC family protein [Marinobacterium sediminicola]SMR71527.1 Ala-tRNA(Pro) deacylase [Marinobacterium sediminicola]
MSLAPTVQRFLEGQHVAYRMLHHTYAETMMSSAMAAQLPARKVAKGVVLKDEEGFVMAMVPSDRMADLEAINHSMNRLLEPASQQDVNILFSDCKQGAVPSLGQAYNMPVIWDDALAEEDDCYFECGDHMDLLRLDKSSFAHLMAAYPHGRISH